MRHPLSAGTRAFSDSGAFTPYRKVRIIKRFWRLTREKAAEKEKCDVARREDVVRLLAREKETGFRKPEAGHVVTEGARVLRKRRSGVQPCARRDARSPVSSLPLAWKNRRAIRAASASRPPVVAVCCLPMSAVGLLGFPPGSPVRTCRAYDATTVRRSFFSLRMALG